MMPQPARSPIEDIIGDIYETISAPEAWPAITDGLSRHMKAHANWLIQPRTEGPALVSFSGISSAGMADYATYYHSVDLFVKRGMARFAGQMPGPLRESDILEEADYRHSEVYNDWMMPNGVVHFLTAALGPIGAAPPPIVTFFLPLGAEPFSEREVGLFRTLLPHMRRAVRVRDSLAGGPGIGLAAVEVLDRLVNSVFLMDGQGRLVHANAPGRGLLDRHDGLRLRHRHLTGISSGESTQLARILGDCLGTNPHGGEMLLRREDGTAQALLATPLTEMAFGGNGIRVCVVVVNLHSADTLLASRLVTLFGVTKSEARVAIAIANGMTPIQISESHNVSLATIRTQISSIYQKFQINRHGDLVRLLARLAV